MNLAVRWRSTAAGRLFCGYLGGPDGAVWDVSRGADRKICCAGLTRWLNATVPLRVGKFSEQVWGDSVERGHRSRIPAFVTLSKTVRINRDRILAAIELGLSNSKLEGLNSKIRLINHRGYGHHSAAALIAMIYLCCGGLTIQLPTER